MTIERADIEKLAKLAQIGITEENIVATTNSINSVLTLVDQLQAADTTAVEPMANPLDGTQRLRADTVSEANCRENFQHIAPAVVDGLYLVPRVIE